MNEINSPIEIAKNIYWVGYVIPNDPFQCHVYLIKNGDESILIDPGSKITWAETRKKILQIMPLEDIKYFVTQHQDPDITACIEDIFSEIGTKGRMVVSHWRTIALLKHYDWGVDFYEIEENDWELKTKSTILKFIFTPYMHFPGAFCSYDSNNKILFSSDIFGGFTETFQLYAKDAQSYFEQMKPFHTHYMPTREIVNHGLDNISKYELDMILPQHGSIIKKEFIETIFTQLRDLDVGLFLKFNDTRDVKLLTRAQEVLTKIFTEVAYNTNAFEVINKVHEDMAELFDIKRSVSFGFVDGDVVLFDSTNKRAYKSEITISDVKERYPEMFLNSSVSVEKLSHLFDLDFKAEQLIYGFIAIDDINRVIGVIFFVFDADKTLQQYQIDILKKFQIPFNIMLSKTIEHYKLEAEKNHFFKDSITDSLTKLYNRHFLQENGQKEFINAKRYNYPLCVAMFDLDHFKKVNDTYGHDVGDIVLKDFARHIRSIIRDGDQAYRFGGEEFIVMLPHTSAEDALQILNRIRSRIIQSNGVKIGQDSIMYRFSAGIHQISEYDKSLDDMIKNADKKLYFAKENGRDKIII
ncbi:diguanylate cyclase [Sulfurimonas aquatica]|uniref:diguanylate cyclase n=1 Tax=Sulfurimonas aquatica TaxID=2672570 RepID=A0A975B2F5_9BACT|nr:diguanylate cyclase [Sulfurimonas aquatica]QSZ43007.1 diguanylate cyclase [Sulfurimonas aquatica]